MCIPWSYLVTTSNSNPEKTVGIPIINPENVAVPPSISAYKLAEDTTMKKDTCNTEAVAGSKILKSQGVRWQYLKKRVATDDHKQGSPAWEFELWVVKWFLVALRGVPEGISTRREGAFQFGECDRIR